MGLLFLGLGGGIGDVHQVGEGAGRQVSLEFEYAGGRLSTGLAAAKTSGTEAQLRGGVIEAEFFIPLLLAGALGVGGVFGLHLPVPALVIYAGLQGAMVVAAHLGQLAEDLAQALPAFCRGGFVSEQFSAELDQFDGEQAGEAVADVQAAGVGKLGLFLGQGGDQLAGFLLAEPIEVATRLPFGEVLLAEWASAEVTVEDFADFFRLVEPVDEVLAGLAVLEAAVEFGTDGVREAGDFSISCCHEAD
jgi:hypothetical protein